MQRELKGDMANLPENKIEAYIIGELQNISWNHEISLIGVKPVKGDNIQMFQEILFDIQLSGEYFDLFQWLLDLRDQLGFIVIKNLELNSVNASQHSSQLLMKLKIASYRRT
jgi:Tfp pilus assembly protein PilO